MECKIKKDYLIKWHDLISVASADIECDIEKIEEKLEGKNSLFFTGKIAKDEVVVETDLLTEIKKGVQKPQKEAEENYISILQKHGFVLEVIKAELEEIKVEEKAHNNKPKEFIVKNAAVNEKQAQLSLFG